MKVGDMVIVNVPWTRTPTCHGIIVEMRTETPGTGERNRTWCYVLRGDTGMIEKFHEDWMKAGKNENW